MKLAVGKIISAPSLDADIGDYVLYGAERNVDVNFIQLNNESKNAVIVNLFIEFVEERIRILPLDKEIDANGMIIFENLKYSLLPYEKIIARVSTTEVITYLINGEHTT